MKILVDITHPAHVHLFKNFIRKFKENGNEVVITVKEKECVCKLLDNLGFNYFFLNKSHKSLFRKALTLFSYLKNMREVTHNFEPDLFLSHGSISAAFVSTLARKPHISLEDTGNLEQILLYSPFTRVILSPKCLKLNMGKKHIKYDGYHELAYLHYKYFTPNKNILNILNIKPSEKFAIIRFGAYGATHDLGHRGSSLHHKIQCVEELSKHVRVFISSESKLHPYLKRYEIKIPPEKMHDAIYYASLVYTEGATVASEASLLGTPTVYVYFKNIDYTKDQWEKYKTIFHFGNSLEEQEESIKKGVELLLDNSAKKQWEAKRQRILNDTVNVTEFLVWFVENYPGSADIIRDNPNYQYNFK